MEPEEAVEYCQTDPNLEKFEKEFSVGFTKDSDKARIHSSIASQIRGALVHTDIDIERLTVFNKDEKKYLEISLEDFDGQGAIVGFVGEVPIESLKINGNPRKNLSYAQIISNQQKVNIDD